MTIPFGIGQPVRRKEDLRLVTGRGEFSDDLNVDGQAYACILRSPHAHAVIRAIDPSAALAAPGVLAVLTGRDYVAEGLRSRSLTRRTRATCRSPISMARTVVVPPDYPIAVDKVRHVGEAVAMIVAETRRRRIEAAELVRVSYDALPAVVDVTAALAPGAAAIWDDSAR